MPTGRIIIVSPDPGFGQQLVTALKPLTSHVDCYPSLAAPDSSDLATADLVVIHGDRMATSGEQLARLTGEGPVIVVLSRWDLAVVVELLQSSRRLAGVLDAGSVDAGRLAAMATRALAKDRFGLAQLMSEGTQIHTQEVGDYQQKSRCMAQVSRFVEQAGASRSYRESIEQCMDEMLMNALYDAPVDAHGNHIFAEVPTRARIALRSEHTVVVQYGYDGKQFAVSVRDGFGSLDRHTVLRYLHKGLHAEQQVERKAGGAGLGLYLMTNSATAVAFTILPGIATEAVCIFDLAAPKLQLATLACYIQADPAGRIASGPARRLAARPRSRSWMIATIAAVGTLLAVVTLGRGLGDSGRAEVTVTTIPRGATIELDGQVVGHARTGTLEIADLEPGRAYQVIARLEGHEATRSVVKLDAGPNAVTFELQALAALELDSDPTGAKVEVDGKLVGSTPFTLTSGVPGSTVALGFERVGYRTATARIQLPPRGNRKRFVQPLERSDEFVLVHFVSVPPGAEVRRTGQSSSVDHTYTPTDLFVEANQEQRFTLTMPKHVPFMIAPFTPIRGTRSLEKGGTLEKGATLRIEGRLGTARVTRAPHCSDVTLPFDCTLAPGSYGVEYRGPDSTKLTRTVTMTSEDAVIRF